MDERKQIAEDTLDQLIEQALRELDRVEPDGLAEERMSDISDEIRRDLWLEETQRTLMLDYITQLNRVAQDSAPPPGTLEAATQSWRPTYSYCL